jgi:hypothetical protein
LAGSALCALAGSIVIPGNPVSAFDSIKEYVSLCENQVFLGSIMSQINDGSGSA